MKQIQTEFDIAYGIPSVENWSEGDNGVLRVFDNRAREMLVLLSSDADARSLECSVPDEFCVKATISGVGDVFKQ